MCSYKISCSDISNLFRHIYINQTAASLKRTICNTFKLPGNETLERLLQSLKTLLTYCFNLCSDDSRL